MFFFFNNWYYKFYCELNNLFLIFDSNMINCIDIYFITVFLIYNNSITNRVNSITE